MVPIDEQLQDLVYSHFRNEVKEQGFVELGELPESPFWPYCKLWIHGQEPIIIAPREPTNGVQIPFNIQIARYALSTLIGSPERVDWKKCVLSIEEESNLTEGFKEQLLFE